MILLEDLIKIIPNGYLFVIKYPANPNNAPTQLLHCKADEIKDKLPNDLIVTSVDIANETVQLILDYQEKHKKDAQYADAPKQSIEKHTCRKCKKNTWSHFDYCQHCGTHLKGLAMTVRTAKWLDIPPNWFTECDYCGGQGFAHYDFCPWCGSKISGIERKE